MVVGGGLGPRTIIIQFRCCGCVKKANNQILLACTSSSVQRPTLHDHMAYLKDIQPGKALPRVCVVENKETEQRKLISIGPNASFAVIRELIVEAFELAPGSAIALTTYEGELVSLDDGLDTGYYLLEIIEELYVPMGPPQIEVHHKTYKKRTKRIKRHVSCAKRKQTWKGSKRAGPCTKCGAAETPLWRKGPNGPHTLCNACGTRWARQNKMHSSSMSYR